MLIKWLVKRQIGKQIDIVQDALDEATKALLEHLVEYGEREDKTKEDLVEIMKTIKENLYHGEVQDTYRGRTD